MEPWYRNVEASIIGKLDAQERKGLKKQSQIKQRRSVNKERGGDM
ncbi:hypothetical protein [Weissella sagaensis]|nr:hypothetical protein [Weissella sagaensis]